MDDTSKKLPTAPQSLDFYMCSHGENGIHTVSGLNSRIRLLNHIHSSTLQEATAAGPSDYQSDSYSAVVAGCRAAAAHCAAPGCHAGCPSGCASAPGCRGCPSAPGAGCRSGRAAAGRGRRAPFPLGAARRGAPARRGRRASSLWGRRSGPADRRCLRGLKLHVGGARGQWWWRGSWGHQQFCPPSAHPPASLDAGCGSFKGRNALLKSVACCLFACHDCRCLLPACLSWTCFDTAAHFFFRTVFAIFMARLLLHMHWVLSTSTLVCFLAPLLFHDFAQQEGGRVEGRMK